ncbi:MAG: DUF1254 domain-containing protein [Solirubrobacteraceae bacterium]
MSVNNDTIYTIATVDLSGGPVVLHVPDTAGRYYVLQFVDAWSNNFAYVGRRATGTEEGEFLLAPRDWEGSAPDGLRVIEAPTRVFSIVGRIAVDGEQDLPQVRALQNEFTLTQVDDTAGLEGVPAPDVSLAEELRFFDAMRLWAQAFPPPAAEREYLERLRPLGLLDRDAPYANPNESLAGALGQGF